MADYLDFARWVKASKKQRKKIIREIKGNIILRMKILHILEYIAGTLALALLLVFFIDNFSEYEPRYAVASEIQANGDRYQYVTERKCEVTEITDSQIFVEYKGNVYSYFYDKSERQLLRVGDTVWCQFTDNWEIVGTTKWEAR